MNEPCCCDYYQLYNIPHTFIIARHQYDVEICEFVRDDDGSYLYGDHSDVELTIRVALRMKCGESRLRTLSGMKYSMHLTFTITIGKMNR